MWNERIEESLVYKGGTLNEKVLANFTWLIDHQGSPLIPDLYQIGKNNNLVQLKINLNVIRIAENSWV